MKLFNFLPPHHLIDAEVEFRHIDLSVNKPKIYSSNELHLLLHLTPNGNPNSYHPGLKVVRFLVRVNGAIFFGQEGYPDEDVPAHFQLADEDPEEASCLSAGNAFFNEDNQLCLLNNKSGDFKPKFQTLQYALAALLHHNIAIHPDLKIHELGRTGGLIMEHSIEPEELVELKAIHQRLFTSGVMGLSRLNLFAALQDPAEFGQGAADHNDAATDEENEQNLNFNI